MSANNVMSTYKQHNSKTLMIKMKLKPFGLTLLKLNPIISSS